MHVDGTPGPGGIALLPSTPSKGKRVKQPKLLRLPKAKTGKYKGGVRMISN